jgi:flavin-dependent dehydrogenase
MVPFPESVDVLVVGAGPAGAVAASILARKGFKVLVVERLAFPRHVIGESLLPRCLDLLAEAGLMGAVERRGYEPKHGATFVRGGKVQRFAFRDNLPGDAAYAFQVPRDDFDQTLATAAFAQGADVRFGAGVRAVTMREDRGKTTAHVVLFDEHTEREVSVTARFVLDASGPARVLAKAFGLEEPSDLMTRTAMYTHVEGDRRPSDDTAGDIFITLHPEGAWIWIIPFSNGRTSVGVVADPQVFEGTGAPSERFWALVRGEPAAAERLADARQALPIQVLRGWSTRTRRLAGRGYAIAGNAGDFLDPVFSSGVMFALESGSLAAHLAARELAGESVDWEAEYEGVLKQAVDVFRVFVKAWYSGELPELFFFDRKPMSAIRHITSILGGNVRNPHNPFVSNDTRAELDRMLAAVHHEARDARRARGGAVETTKAT